MSLLTGRAWEGSSFEGLIEALVMTRWTIKRGIDPSEEEHAEMLICVYGLEIRIVISSHSGINIDIFFAFHYNDH